MTHHFNFFMQKNIVSLRVKKIKTIAMRTRTIDGYLYVNLCSKSGHKHYQNIFEDPKEGVVYIYETDHPSFLD